MNGLAHQNLSLKKTGKATVALAAVCMLFAGAASAEVYKCTGADGKVTFGDSPCTGSANEKVLKVRPNTIDTSQDRNRQLVNENSRLQEQLSSQRVAAAQAPHGHSEQIDRRGNSADCASARRDYEVEASSIARTDAKLRARESMMYGACGMREPERTSNVTNVEVHNGRVRDSADLAPPAFLPVAPRPSR